MEEEYMEAPAAVAIVGERFCSEEERELTVRKTSFFSPGDGFAAYDHKTGDLVFRVDTYARKGTAFADHHLLLTDPCGTPILTLCRKWPSLHQRWEAFVGERSEGQKPLFSVRRSSIFGGNRGAYAVEVHSEEAEYRIEGCFAQRCCRVLYEGGRVGGSGEIAADAVVAEIKRKVDASANVVLGRDVFSLCLRPRCDSAFVMGLVIVLDQVSGDVDEVEEVPVNDYTAENLPPAMEQLQPEERPSSD